MKQFNNRKSIIEKGGLMIEALAMLGMIAVVTPTMYKKSAERTMEVEDINTATSMRTTMNGLNSLISNNYIELMEQIEPEQGEDGNQIPKIVKLDTLHITVGTETNDAKEELKRYLPYGYDPEKELYNYGAPEYYVARNGNNLSAFVTFPAKAGEDDETSIGQERTSRIASLIGANGGYVHEEGGANARGVGGTWSIPASDIGNPGKYSIVTSSIDVVDSSTSGGTGENTKYLQRTAENGEIWRNTMRTDIYMGEIENSDQDYDDKDTNGYFSIRNINQLIVGADGYIRANDTSNNQDEDASDLANLYKGAKGAGNSDFANFGLYIADNVSGAPAGAKHGINAYIAGSLEAAGKMLFADEEELTYKGPKIQLGGMGTTEGSTTKYLIEGSTTKAEEGVEDSHDTNIVRIIQDKIVVSDQKLEEGVASAGDETKVLLNKDGYNKDAAGNDIDAPKYTEDGQPDFGVVVDSNMAVNGIMAAGQVDTNKIRATSLSVGSEHIDDKVQWMNVDASGVHIEDFDTEKEQKGSKAKVQVDVRTEGIVMRYDANSKDADPDPGLSGHTSQFWMDGSGVETRVHGNDKKIGIATDKLRMDMKDDEMLIGGQKTEISSAGVFGEQKFGENENPEQYRVKYQEGGHVDMVGTTLQVTDKDNKPVFTVQGNNNQNINGGPNDPSVDFEGDIRKNTSFKIAGHGNTVFTSDAVVADGDNNATKFLAMGTDERNTDSTSEDNQYDAAVNIVGNSTESSDRQQRVIYVDLDTGHSAQTYTGPQTGAKVNGHGESKLYYYDSTEKKEKEEPNRNISLSEGSIYIRKGLIDIAPARSEDPGNGEQSARTADNASGTVRASRFVANNVDTTGKRVKYVNPIYGAPGTELPDDKTNVYHQYNGNSEHPYDTYMVNPAYTSVMKDIKLTSRLGARLSDILPDFITKAIYTSRNNIDETAVDVSNIVNGIAIGSNDHAPANFYASPFLGTVAAPQCPPGYGRVITVVPQEFKMAQVGYLKADVPALNVESGTIASGLAVDDDIPYLQFYNSKSRVENKLDRSLDMKDSADRTAYSEAIQPKMNLHQLTLGEAPGEDTARIKTKASEDNMFGISGQTENSTTGTAHSHALTNAKVDLNDKYLQIENIAYVAIHDVDPDNGNFGWESHKAPVYTFTSDQSNGSKTVAVDGLRPVTFQQSTWLKSVHKTVLGNGDYVKGWDVLLGFIYPAQKYRTILEEVQGTEGAKKYLEAAGDSEATTYFWNVFPVRKDTLNALITTYCYFDNKGRPVEGNITALTSAQDAFDEVKGVDVHRYDYTFDGSPDDYMPETKAMKYRKTLNDPALKYDELW